MTVPTPTSVAGPYAGNDVTTIFAYGFRIFEAGDLVVIKTEVATGVEVILTLTTHYTVSGVDDLAGGSVTLLTALATGYTLEIRRILDIVQETDLRNQGAFHAETHEDAFDRGIMIDQQLQAQFNDIPEFPEPEDGLFLAWDGTDLVNTEGTVGPTGATGPAGAVLAMAAGEVARMTGQNRFRFLNTMAKIYKSIDQVIADSTITLVAFDLEDVDTDAIHHLVTNNTRLVVKLTGKYLIGGLGQWAASDLGKRQILFGVNGTLQFSGVGDADTTGGTDLPGCYLETLVAGDYVEMSVQQTSGGALNLIGGTKGNSLFWMIYMGE